MDKELKNEVWGLLENYKENLSDEIGWGSMDSLCDELINTIKNQSEELLNYHQYLKKELIELRCSKQQSTMTNIQPIN
jgi:hypothetical protein